MERLECWFNRSTRSWFGHQSRLAVPLPALCLASRRGEGHFLADALLDGSLDVLDQAPFAQNAVTIYTATNKRYLNDLRINSYFRSKG